MPEPEIILSISKVGIHLNCGGDYLERSFGTPCTKIYYVESSDEILRSIKLFIPRGVYDEYCVTNMLISKFDFSSMTRVEVTSLDGHVLFLSGTTRLCCSAKELGYARGWVYFTQPREMSFCKYDLEDKTFMLSMPCPDLPKPWFSPNWLMIPTTLCRDDDSSNTKVIENSSLAISPIRPRTSINNDDDEKEDDIEEARPPWHTLSEDILWFLSSYLSPLDYTHLRAVCRNYRSVFPIKDWRKFCSTRTLRTNVLSPWMVFPKDNESVYSFINPVHNDENYLTSIPELLKGLTIRCTKERRLVTHV